jgi:hypothetical protein
VGLEHANSSGDDVNPFSLHNHRSARKPPNLRDGKG